jgi:hypothetical protein
MRWCERTTATSSRGDEKIGVRDCVCAMERVKQLHERDVGPIVLDPHPESIGEWLCCLVKL